ncbi:EAL domain-containing protein (putative c-di-GMP-specific phosphodiesterase class I) [Pantoea agglomerans]|jgi:EAL domain-containing protein (putative c-di-GMP-specific phosphodiesterase class I)|uniref:diguanylate phosphodiesterase n=1 Tax=Pantoea TaxID=53335 RepID=UPI00026D244D|nr:MULTISPECIES: diguanylate phosphodiesterase [Pantoea]EZI34623.1 Diguanylate phosphodiesterase [Pantoea agglomerans]KAF6639413.1 diguanylate phosphodiesterase [Pantoea sp. EKM10T]KDA95733.1 diguanylate phosphodiesterase [Pantoea agglomerans Eh318]KJH60310.1 diguanylate phosphodiesterase [Pantoea agglomerans]KNH28591.1 diguanylate phosphodiesterase [Pantoea vagans]
MLSTIIYRSHITEHVPLEILNGLARKANKINKSSSVTGILLFNGTHFFQLLEGPEAAVNAVYSRICQDPRHHNLVELLRDYAPARRFGHVGMELFDLRLHDKETVLEAVLAKCTTKYQLTYADRALQFLRTFVEAREKENYFEIPAASGWTFICDESEQREGNASLVAADEVSFAFQPIVDPFACEIVSLEALLRGPQGEPPLDYFARLSREQLYQLDLRSKKIAFAQAKQLGIEGMTLSINLLPMTLVEVPDAVPFLLDEIAAQGLVPEQIMVEFTENEIISQPEAFEAAIRQLKAAGISLALDDFGAGFAGLSLLTRIQPDKIKIDRTIIADVHKSGPKQAIIHAILKCCSSLEIGVIAEGIEQPEEWMWLEAAGVTQFQGFLFSKPVLNGVAAVAWPELI